eukprot:GILJ01003194.1.p1 GENE.GILJ01003194.1~~GILJ01003194.1.p1  ORF type:complete len:303 (-),score=37.99 GILJ01003194.1:273-1181(-)
MDELYKLPSIADWLGPRDQFQLGLSRTSNFHFAPPPVPSMAPSSRPEVFSQLDFVHEFSVMLHQLQQSVAQLNRTVAENSEQITELQQHLYLMQQQNMQDQQNKARTSSSSIVRQSPSLPSPSSSARVFDMSRDVISSSPWSRSSSFEDSPVQSTRTKHTDTTHRLTDVALSRSKEIHKSASGQVNVVKSDKSDKSEPDVQGDSAVASPSKARSGGVNKGGRPPLKNAFCFTCGTTKTCFWRRNGSDKRYCNACGLRLLDRARRKAEVELIHSQSREISSGSSKAQVGSAGGSTASITKILQ